MRGSITAAAALVILAVASHGASESRWRRAAMCHLDVPQDVVIILDSSTSIARPDFSKQLKFVSDFVNQFKIGLTASQVGVISFSNNEVLNFHLNRYANKAELQEAILKIKQIGGGTNTHKPLEYVRTKMFVPAGGDRADVRNLCIVITDGQSSNPAETARQAKLARDSGIEIHALGIGPGVAVSELHAISGDERRSYTAQDFNTLNTIIEQFKKTQECPFSPPGNPVITKSPAGPVSPGEKVKLKCTSAGLDDDTTLSWTKDGVQVSGVSSKNESHHITELDYSGSGTGSDFECRLQHPKMNDTLRVTDRVDVLPGPPVITGTPRDAVRKGTPVRLTATSLGTDPRTRLTWYKNGVEVDSSHTIVGENVVNHYEFTADDDTAEAKYEARVSHPLLPRPLVAETKLDTFVLPGPPIIHGTPADAVVHGTRVTLRATSLGTDPQTKLVWYKDGQEVDGTHAIQPPNVVNEYSFSADGSQPAHIFEARVTHPRLPQPLTNITEVHVYVLPGPPVITGVPADAVAIGTQVRLTATSLGTDPSTQLLWYRDGQQIDGSFNIQPPNVVNHYEFTTDESSGNAIYEARVTHPRLRAPLKAEASVSSFVLPGPPVITGTPSDAVEHGTPVTLRATSRGTDKDTQLVWYQDGKELDRSYAVQAPNVVNEYTFTADGTKPRSTFEARVTHPRLRAPLSATTAVDTYVLPQPPIITGTPADAVEHGTSVTLRATSLGTDKDTQLVWYQDGREVDRSYAIQAPNVANEYKFTADGSVPRSRFEARVTHPRLRTPLSANTAVDTYVLPGPPIITGTPTEAVEHGSSITLRATSLGTDRDTQLVWYQDGKELDRSYAIQQPDVVNEYTFAADRNKPSSTFEARVTHPRLRAPLSATTVVGAYALPGPPVIVEAPRDAVAHGSPVTLRATSLGTDPNTQLVWYEDGREVDRSYAIQAPNVVNEYTFTADNRKPKATYEARVTHPRLPAPLRASTPVEVYALPGPPVIVEAPKDAVEHGSPVTLRATSVGTDPNTQLVWYEDGREVDRTYAIQGPNVVNEYTFTADSRKPKATYEARVTHPRLPAPLRASTPVEVYALPGPPVIVEAPKDAVEHGSPVTLRATSLGTDPNTQLVWYEDGREVDLTYAIQGPNVVNEYTFTADSRKPKATYEARVLHPRLPAPLRASTPVEVYALPGPPVIVEAPRDAVEQGSPVTLRATSAGTDPNTQLVWYEDGREVDRTYTIQGPNVVNEYTFTADSRKPKATYEARVTHPRLPALLRASTPVEVYALPGPPVIVQAPRDAVQHGSPVTLRATSLGTDPNTQLVWYEDGREVDRTYAIQGPNVVNEYTFTADSRKPKATYEARVVHPRLPAPLRASTPVEIYALPGPPQISGAPDAAILPGQRVSLVAHSLGTDPNTELVWYRNGNPVDRSHEISGPHVVNRYDFVAGPGDAQAVFEAKVHHPRLQNPLVADTDLKLAQEKPVITGLPREPVERGSRVQLQCRSSPAVDGTRLVWYKDGIQVDDSFSQTPEATVNEYSFAAPADSQLECRAIHPNLDAPLVARGSVNVTDCNLRSRELDVVFLVDSSSSIYEPDFRTIMNFLASVADVFNVGLQKHRIGAAIFSDRPYKAFLLSEFGSLEQVQRALRSIRKVLGSTHTDRALSYLHNRLLLPSSGARVNVPKVAFIVTDGHSYDPKKTAEEAKKLRQAGVTVYAIAIGSHADHEELLALAGRQQGVFKSSFSELTKVKADIQALVRQCRLLQPPEPVDGGWTSWEPSGPCSVTCGEGVRTMIRECSNPPPSNGGQPCSGATSMVQKCRASVSCQCSTNSEVDADLDSEDNGNGHLDFNGGRGSSGSGGWSPWTYDTPCSIPCGSGGTQSISRTCLSPFADCELGQVDTRVVACQPKSCGPIADVCNSKQHSVDVLIIAHGLGDRILSIVRNLSTTLPVDGQHVRLAVSLPDCGCRPVARSAQRGFTLHKYSHASDVVRHIDSLVGESRPTLGATIRRAREDNGVVPSPDDDGAGAGRARRDSPTAKRVAVVVIDGESQVDGDAERECRQLKLAGYDVFGLAVGIASNRGLERLVTEPASRYYLRADADTPSQLRKEICQGTSNK